MIWMRRNLPLPGLRQRGIQALRIERTGANALQERAEQLGVVVTTDNPNESHGAYEIFRQRISEAELQSRVMEAERHVLARRAWFVTVIAAIASAISALAAWTAVYIGH